MRCYIIQTNSQIIIKNTTDKLDCCDQPEIIENNEGIKVCKNCGTTYGSSLVFMERRSYTAEEVKNRKRTEPVWRNYGARTVISHDLKDRNGRYLKPEQRKLFRRLKKINRSLSGSVERNFLTAQPLLNMISSKLYIPDYVKETAWRIYLNVVEKKLTMGRTIKGFIGASLYAAIRIYEIPKIFDDIVDVTNVPKREIHKSLSLIIRKILPDLGLKYKPVTISQLVYRFGSNLNIDLKTQKYAVKILRDAFKRGVGRSGKDPKGLAAAALYISAYETPFKRTQREIADHAKITEVTLRNDIKIIKKAAL